MHFPKQRKKLDSQCTPAIYLGPMGKGHQMYDPLTRKVFQVSIVLFDEKSFGLDEILHISKMIGSVPLSFEYELDETGNDQPADPQWVHDMNALIKKIDGPSNQYAPQNAPRFEDEPSSVQIVEPAAPAAPDDAPAAPVAQAAQAAKPAAPAEPMVQLVPMLPNSSIQSL
jgi:hypothetical protein